MRGPCKEIYYSKRAHGSTPNANSLSNHLIVLSPNIQYILTTMQTFMGLFSSGGYILTELASFVHSLKREVIYLYNPLSD